MSRSQEYNEQGYDVPFVDEHGELLLAICLILQLS